MYSGRLDIGLPGFLMIDISFRKTMVFCSADTSPRGPYDPVLSGLDVTDLVQSRMDVFMKQQRLRE